MVSIQGGPGPLLGTVERAWAKGAPGASRGKPRASLGPSLGTATSVETEESARRARAPGGSGGGEDPEHGRMGPGARKDQPGATRRTSVRGFLPPGGPSLSAADAGSAPRRAAGERVGAVLAIQGSLGPTRKRAPTSAGGALNSAPWEGRG